MKVAIVGGSPSSWELAPYGDTQREIWVLGNQLDRYKGKRVTRIFEIHDNLEEHGDVQQYCEWLVSQNIPLVVGGEFDRAALKKASKFIYFPEEEANELLGGEYLSSSPAYMMALAILEGATEIGIYGVDMAVDDHEYFHQRPEMYAWIAYAKARGIKIIIPEQSSLFRGGYVEGRDWGGNSRDSGPFTESQFLQKADQHSQKVAELRAQIDQLQANINAHEGAKQVYEKLAQTARALAANIPIKTLKETSTIKE